MLVLVLNCGSSSAKYKLFDMSSENLLISGLAERIGLPGSRLQQQAYTNDPINTIKKEILDVILPDHHTAIEVILQQISKAIPNLTIQDIEAVGHRVVHGGETFTTSTLIDDTVIQQLEQISFLAPLHNPPNITGIKVCRQLLPYARQVAVFDTAFHQTIPPHAYMYAIPYKYYQKYGLRKYGFHGTSHRYVAYRSAELLNRPLDELKLITCHLGNGASICAIKNGRVADTTMGFTPLCGLIMGTRCGDIDPAIVTFLQIKEGLSPNEINDILNKQSGVLGISGLSSDFRDLEEAASIGNQRAQLALDMFVYSVQKWIGAFTAAMGGVDAIVFTGGIGENSPYIRQRILLSLKWLGIILDEKSGNVRGQEALLTVASSPLQALVIPTNEELMIARDTVALLTK